MKTSNRLYILWVSIGIFLAIGTVVWINTRQEPSAIHADHLPLETSQTTAGENLEIFSLSSNPVEFGEDLATPGLSLLSPFHSTGSSTHFTGGLNTEEKSRDGETVFLRVKSESPKDLMMQIRLTDDSSTPRSIHSSLQPHRVVSQNTRIAPRKEQKYHFYEPRTSGLESIMEAMELSGLEILFQYHDPDVGWIDMNGPCMVWEPWPDRYFVYLDCWQRDQPTLGFRMIEQNGMISEFSMPNPDRVKKPKPLKAVPLPYVHTAAGFTFAIHRLRRLPSDVGEHPFTALDLDISYTGPVVQGLPKGPLYFGTDRNLVTDEWGNTTTMDSKRVGKKSVYGVRLPLNSEYATIGFDIERTRDYPQESYSGIDVFEGTVNPAGTAIEFKETRNASRFGHLSITSGKVAEPGYNSYKNTEGKGWKELTFALECRTPVKKYEALQSRLGDIQNWMLLAFTEGETLSSGLGRAPMGGSGRSRNEVSFQENFSKIFPPESLQPGKTIRIAIHPVPGIERFEAILALPDPGQPSQK